MVKVKAAEQEQTEMAAEETVSQLTKLLTGNLRSCILTTVSREPGGPFLYGLFKSDDIDELRKAIKQGNEAYAVVNVNVIEDASGQRVETEGQFLIDPTIVIKAKRTHLTRVELPHLQTKWGWSELAITNTYSYCCALFNTVNNYQRNTCNYFEKQGIVIDDTGKVVSGRITL